MEFGRGDVMGEVVVVVVGRDKAERGVGKEGEE
eukprot:COSAG02_NODE_55201_length_292_cov_0.331606_1_plen_33_part_00